MVPSHPLWFDTITLSQSMPVQNLLMLRCFSNLYCGQISPNYLYDMRLREIRFMVDVYMVLDINHSDFLQARLIEVRGHYLLLSESRKKKDRENMLT